MQNQIWRATPPPSPFIPTFELPPTAIIRFYRASEPPFGAFSNFARYPVGLDGKIWPTTEHYFQAQKFAPTASEHAAKIHAATDLRQVVALGRSREYPLRADWEQVKEEIMARALAAKFGQHQRLRQLLLQTGQAVLVEHTNRDAYWGDGGDGRGRNRLGHLLMALRTTLRQTQFQRGE